MAFKALADMFFWKQDWIKKKRKRKEKKKEEKKNHC